MCVYNLTEYYGRLGNNIIQLCSIYIKGKNTVNYSIKKHNIINFKLINNVNICNCSKNYYFNNEQLDCYDLSLMKNIYKKHFCIDFILPICDNYDIGIHIRSGDIFQTIGKSHQKYLQPPLYFYEKIINANILKNIIIVYESFHNPVINCLIQKYSNFKNVTFQSSNIKNDIYALSNCKELVISNGTFWLAPYFESNKIEKLIIADYMKDNHWFNFDKNTIIETILLPNYMQNQIWKNTKEQRNIMLNYSL